jgi:DNA-binding MarR family transcriptional regulator
VRVVPGQQGARSRERPVGSAEAAWILLQQFVDGHDRHGEMARALGFGLGAGRGRVLFQLRQGPMTLTEVAEANRVDAPYATLIVDKLESHGLVERRPHPEDRRRKLVTLTAAGHQAIATADAIRSRPPPAMAALGAEDVRRLTAILRHLVDTDDPAGPGTGPTVPQV